MRWHISSRSVSLTGQDGVWIHRLGDDAYLCAVLDGHGDNREVVDYTLNRLGELAHAVPNLTDTAQHLTDTVHTLAKETATSTSGACITLAHLLPNGVMHAVSLGDAPILWGPCDFQDITDLSGLAPHSVAHNIRERTRLMVNGVRIIGKYMLSPSKQDMLAVSRSLGDRTFEPYILREPEVGTDMIAAGDFVLLATDGFCDVVLPLSKTRTDWKAGIHARHDAATLIHTHMLKYGIYDDTTLIVAYRY